MDSKSSKTLVQPPTPKDTPKLTEIQDIIHQSLLLRTRLPLRKVKVGCVASIRRRHLSIEHGSFMNQMGLERGLGRGGGSSSS